MTNSILVGLDGSSGSRRAFHAAIDEAQWRGTDVCVFHVVFVPMVLGKRLDSRTGDELESYGHYIVDQELEVLAESYADGFPVNITRHVRAGHLGEELLAAVSDPDLGVELVVLGARGLGGFRSLVLGSVTNYAVHNLTCPLLIIPPDADDG